MSWKDIGTIEQLTPYLEQPAPKRLRIGFRNRILDLVGLYDPYAVRQNDNDCNSNQAVFEALVMTLTEPETAQNSAQNQ